MKLLLSVIMLAVTLNAHATQSLEVARAVNETVSEPDVLDSNGVANYAVISNSNGNTFILRGAPLGIGEDNKPYYHSPQYMVGYPSAGVIWPRIVEVLCEKVNNALVCDGYNWTPAMGRGEYLFVTPTIKRNAKAVEYTEVKRVIYRESNK